MVRLALLLTAAAALGGCKTRLIDGPLVPEPPDFAVPPDLTVIPDFAPPPDLVPPFFCKPIYVIDALTQVLSGFIPDGKNSRFVDVGKVNCTTKGSPDTMSIDLSGFAWIFYTNGSLFKVDLSDPKLACTRTPFDPTNINQDQLNATDWRTFGSSFSRDMPGSDQETLFVSLGESQLTLPTFLASIDPNTFAYTVGPPIGTPIELTGTPDAQLWMFNPLLTGAHIARLDKQTGVETQRIDIPQITVTGDFAFATWGGSFWIFNGDGPQNSDTSVYEVEPNGTTARMGLDR